MSIDQAPTIADKALEMFRLTGTKFEGNGGKWEAVAFDLYNLMVDASQSAPDRQEQESLTGAQALHAAEVMRLQASPGVTHCGSGKDMGTLCGLTDENYTLDTQYNCPACKAICPSFADFPPSDVDISAADTVALPRPVEEGPIP